ncbi:MAG: hypothetical protein ACLVFU_01165 [Eggerthellaceae bacterium]
MCGAPAGAGEPSRRADRSGGVSGASEEFLSDLRFSAVTEFFGAEFFTRAGIIRELERLRQMIRL